MRRLVLSLAALGSAGLFAATPAMAGGCGQGVPAENCKVPIQYMSGPAPVFDPITVYSTQPMSHLRTIQYRSAPNVSIMRVYGQGQTVGLSDFPSKFTGGCHPTSTRYCRQAAPAAAPAPAPRPAVVTHRQTVDTSKFTPRVYGSNELVPGIAHVPTSIVDRSWENAMAALNSGRTRPQPVASGGMVPHPTQMSAPAPMAAPLSIATPPPMAPMPVPVVENHGVVTETISGGEYWEKVSGPQMIGGTMATQVICKRKAPDVQVQRQVVGVPVQAGCVPPQTMAQPMPMSEPVLAGGPVSRRYGY